MQTLFDSKYPYLPFVSLMLLSLLLFIVPEPLQQLLAYQRAYLKEGELWRLVTGHLLHSNLYHLLLNTGGLLLIMLLHAGYQRQLALRWQLLLSALLISGLIYGLNPTIERYVGLSGVLHALLFFGALMDIQTRKTGGMLLMLGILAKIGYEQFNGPDAELGLLIEATVAIDAHLYGVISGTVLFALVTAKNNLGRKQLGGD
ncbi:rhombosortase [Arsukibacterium sp.]|uniref:rhombosortase n=1 Tax=Arsukibacterium sp. TaxID=1977258 RepID=UPI00299F1641|nr:rhombosortase [Arsukibacterium sp.]MDX1678980.1 rhombosortase [Arsukibacterium sp.]